MAFRRRSFAWALLFQILGLGGFAGSLGCSRTTYEIELTPAGEVIHRSLRIDTQVGSNQEHAVSSLPLEEQRRLSKLYTQESTAPPKLVHEENHFSGTFRLQMPADVGGAGRYVRYQSPMGDLYFYTERFRGSLDLADSLEDRKQAIETMCDLGARWIETEIDDPALAIRLAHWIRTMLRDDLENLSLYLAMIDRNPAGTDPKFAFTVGFYLLQYLIEHDYVTPSDVPLWRRMATLEDQEAMLVWLTGVVAKKLDLDERQADLLKPLQQPEAALARLRNFLKSTDEYAEMLESTTANETKPSREPDPMGIFIWLGLRAFMPDFWPSSESVAVTLHLGEADEEPLQITGDWSAEDRTVTWNRPLRGSNTTPHLMVATWTQPNTEHQEKQLGQAVLGRQLLADYVIWYRSLNDEERREWDDFLESLETESDLAAQIRAFDPSTSDKLFEEMKEQLATAIQNAKTSQP